MKRTPLRRCTPLRRTPFVSKPKRRPGLAVARATALARDGGCVYRIWLSHDNPDERGPCDGPLEFDHVADAKGMGAKGPDRSDHGQIVCAHHHKDGWAASRGARAWSRARLDIMHPTRHADAGCSLSG